MLTFVKLLLNSSLNIKFRQNSVIVQAKLVWIVEGVYTFILKSRLKPLSISWFLLGCQFPFQFHLVSQTIHISKHGLWVLDIDIFCERQEDSGPIT